MNDEQANGFTIPLVVWKFLICLVVLILLLCFIAVAYFHHASLQDFISSGLDVFFVLLKVALALMVVAALVLAYRFYHVAVMHRHERKSAKFQVQKAALQVQRAELQIEMLRAKTEAVKQHPQIITAALQYGFDIEHEGLKIKSSQQGMNVVEGTATKGLLPSPAGITKPTIDEIVNEVEPNSYDFGLGKSLTTGEILINSLNDSHIKIVGGTRMGKSCGAGSIIDQGYRTHDTQHLQVALLDLENKTSRLFANDPHVLTLNNRKMHAISVEQVASYIIMLHSHMIERYSLTDAELLRLPRILIYLEEFLYWKKLLGNFVEPEIQNAAMASFAGIATRGLKVGMHLMVCAQVDYADDDLRDAMAQFIGVNLSYAVRPSAAQAAGFVQTDLLAKNYRDRKPGQFVLEAIGGSDIGVAPEYDVKARLAQLPQGRGIVSPMSETGNFRTGFNQAEIIPPLPDLPLKRGSETEISDFSTYEGRKREVIRLRSLGFTKQAEVLPLIWGKDIKPGENKAYQDARYEYQQILQEIVRSA